MIKLLAKLRQYKDGDIAEYLRTEHRQNLIALEQAFGDNATQQEQSVIVQPGTDVFFASNDSVLSGTIGLSNSTVFAGNLSSNVYYPPEDGDYWVMMGCLGDTLQATVVAAVYSYLRAYTTGLALETYKLDGLSVPANHSPFPTIMGKITITKSTGIYFTATPEPKTTMSRFFCKITKA